MLKFARVLLFSFHDISRVYSKFNESLSFCFQYHRLDVKCKRACKCDPLRDFRFVQTWLSFLPSALNSELLMNRGSCIHPGFSLNRTEKCSTLPSLWINWKPSALIKCLLAQIQARCRNSTWPTSGSQREERGCLQEKRDPSFALALQAAG